MKKKKKKNHCLRLMLYLYFQATDGEEETKSFGTDEKSIW